MNLYPLLMSPYFRHGEQTPWGGDRLEALFGKEAPDDRTGESLEVSALAGMNSVVANGQHKGKSLSEMIARWGERLTGKKFDEFPLLLKLLDAKEMLSVQVHPGDEYAKQHEGKLGKTEAWVVLECKEDAKLVYGVNVHDQRQLRQRVEEGDLENALRWIAVEPGDVLYIPHGMVHALGGGIVVYEIQQSSDVTYRFWDWGRVGADGQPRALHTDQALDVTRAELKMEKQDGVAVECEGGVQTVYIADENFELWRYNVAGHMPLESGRMTMLTALEPVKLLWQEGELCLTSGDSVLLPAELEGVALEGHGLVMCSRVPDREALHTLLGHKAQQVAGLIKPI